VAGAKAVGGLVTLASATVIVQRNGRARIKLKCIATVTCRGTLKLTVRANAKKRSRTTIVLGAATFSLAPGRTTIVKAVLGAGWRVRLNAAHRRRGVRLTIVVLSPSPRRTKTHAVELVLQRRASRPRA
jgi:hypothetical protein